MEEGSEETQSKTQQIAPRDPPIYVAGVQNIHPLKELLLKIAGDDSELKVLQGNQVKIQPKSSEKYSTIIKALAEKHIKFHTYQPKENTSFQVVLRGLHYSTNTQDIKTEIENLSHTVVNIFNIKQSRTNIPLPLFFIDLKQNPNNKEIYSIETLHYTKVTFEPPRPKRSIPQCTKCQRYGHTQAYCFHTSRCVKCAGNHHTKQCSRQEKTDAVKCVLCDGNHPANYKGCSVYTELQLKSFPPLRRRPEVPSKPPPHNKTPAPSYAAALKSPPSLPLPADQQTKQHNMYQQLPQPSQTVLPELQTMLKNFLDQMSIMINLLTTLIHKLVK